MRLWLMFFAGCWLGVFVGCGVTILLAGARIHKLEAANGEVRRMQSLRRRVSGRLHMMHRPRKQDRTTTAA